MVAAGGGGGGGDETRLNFGDTAYFDTVNTNANGIATVKFKLPDNVTTYRVTAHATNKDLYLGETTSKITSTLDFFVQFTEPRGVKVSDDLVLTATSVASNDYKVHFEFTIEELNKTINTSTNTNQIASANFGKLPVGKYHAIIKGTNGTKTDTVKYEFEIVETAQEVKQKTEVNAKETARVVPSKNPIKLEIYNKNMKQYMDYIDFIESTYSSRLDTRLAYNEVQNLKSKYYGSAFSKNDINISDYNDDSNLFKYLKDGVGDVLFSALIKYYTGYGYTISFEKMQDILIFEYYLYAAASNEPVLQDLKYLAEEKNVNNYDKLLLTLSFEFLGDYQDARVLYNKIVLSDEEKEEYAGIIAIINTFINKQKAVTEINSIIEKNPADQHLRFAIISFFQNNSSEIEEEQKVTIKSQSLNETVSINGLEVKTYTIYDSDLSTIEFETSSDDIMVSYYYQTSLEDVKSDKISKDITIRLDGDTKKNNEVTLVINMSKLKNSEGSVRIALPNSLKLAQDYNTNASDYYKNYYLENNAIDYVTFFKTKDCTQMRIPLLVTLDGEYKFENVVFTTGDGIYHISNSLSFGDR